METLENNTTDLKNLKKERLKLKVYAALIIAIVNIIIMYVGWALDLQISATLTSLMQFGTLALVFVWLGKTDSQIIAKYKPLDGYSYGKAVGTAIIAAVMSGIVIAIGAWILYKFIDPSFVQELTDKALATLPDAQQTDNNIMIVEMIVTFFTSFFGLIFTNCFNQAFWGGLIALFTSISAKKEPAAIA